MAKGGGSSNAYTEAQNTNYYFEITVNHLGKSLDAFAHFFIDPLFNEDAVNKERNAVNSEYEIDVSTEDWKVVNLFALLADPKHPASRFSIGNNDVLAKDGVVDALKKFYQDYYSSNVMSLAVQSRLSLQEMEKMVRVFGKIENKNLLPPQISGFPYQFGLLSKYKTEKKLVILNW
jgi:insulysin